MLGNCPPEKKWCIEKNKRTNANRDPKKRNPHFSLTVKVKRGDKGHLEGLRSRLNNAKCLLGIDRLTSLTQNTDLLEALLSYFEIMKSLAWPGCCSDLEWSVLPLSNQGHVCRLELLCVGSDSVAWLRPSSNVELHMCRI